MEAKEEEVKMKKTPIIVCEAVTVDGASQWRFMCKHCRRHHYDSAEAGYRVAHCFNDSPYDETGYILKKASKGGKR
jgi:hypothetical protein